ncbi:MAG: hypothetical protein II414_07260, partial [Erysipelotrichaceae bacterium]|nr:hypothetical protein [Erysipelotrichaceae bacterium]
MTPHVGEFFFKNIRCLNTRGCAGYFYGLPESPIDKITLKDIEVTFDHDFKEFVKPAMIYQCEKVNNGGFYFYNVREKEAENVFIEGEELHF